MSKELGQRTDAELEALFGDMYHGWERGLVITQERFGNGEMRFAERPMTRLELAARFVAAEIGINIYEIANRAAFAPITTFSQIQSRIGPTFEALEAENAALAEDLRTALHDAIEVRKQLDCMQSAIRDAFYAGYFEGRPPIAINGVDRAVREEEAAWKEYADCDGIPLAEEHKPGCQSGDFGPCDCKLSDDLQCQHTPMIASDGMWFCPKCKEKIEMATAQTSPIRKDEQ